MTTIGLFILMALLLVPYMFLAGAFTSTDGALYQSWPWYQWLHLGGIAFTGLLITVSMDMEDFK
jgi:hypothetical protein